MKRRDVWLAIALFCVFGLVAQAEIIRDTAYGGGADTYVTNDNASQGPNSNFGTAATIRARNSDNSRQKIGFLRFDISESAGDMSGATLTLTATFLKGGAKILNVYGLVDETLDSWAESTITYNTAPGLIPNPPTAPGYYAIDATKLTLLGTITAPALIAGPPVNYPIAFTSLTTELNLGSFLSADTNNLVTLVLIAQANSEDEFATKENTVTPPLIRPTLAMPNASTGGAVDPQPLNNSTVNRNILSQLSWTNISGLGIYKCDVYLGIDTGREPNLPEMDKLTFNPAVASVNINDFPSYNAPLADGKYFWRVDCYNDSGHSATEPNLPGVFWNFTATSTPLVTQQPSPEFQAKFPAETAVFTVAFDSSTPITYTWYRSTDNANNTPTDDVSVGTNSPTLTLSNVTLASAGYYYCKAVNPGETRSNCARLSIKRLYAHWALDGNANDSSGNALHGTLFGEPVFDAGVNGTTGQALVFDGVNDYITEPNSLDSFSDFAPGATISVWAKPSTVANWARFIDFGNVNLAGTTLVYSDIIYLSRNGTTTGLSFTAYTGAAGSTAGITVTATNAITLNEWQMFVATMDEAGNIVLYKNGLSIGTGAIAQHPSVATRTRNNVGRSNWSTDAIYAGSMDDIYLYNYAKTADDVANMYSGVVGDYCRYKPALDWNNNCKVDLPDFATFAQQWLVCGLYPNCP